MSHYPQAILTLIAYLKKLPGIGRKTAERFAFELLSWPESELKAFSAHLDFIKENIISCSSCGCFMETDRCHFCNDTKRDPHTLCIISSPKDVYLFEETASYRGLYHVLGSLLSPIDGRGPETLELDKLMERIQTRNVYEVIIALDATLEGDATALYLKHQLTPLQVHISRLALGLPMGSTLDYIDKSTLAQALAGRQKI